MKKQSLIKGSLILGIAGIVTRFLGLFFRWPLIMLIGDEGIGYYQMSYPLYMFFVAMASGIPITVSKLISENFGEPLLTLRLVSACSQYLHIQYITFYRFVNLKSLKF